MKVAVIIPARQESSRFPGKPLVTLLGKPMILWVAEIASSAMGKHLVYVATDDDKIAACVTDAGFQVVMTSSEALTGTDRLWEAAQQIKADIYVNVQGDEPMLNPADIINITEKKKQIGSGVVNGMCPLSPDEDPASPNIPKLVVTRENRLAYMSRLPVPGFKSMKNKPSRYLKQVCIYAFNYEELKAFGTSPGKGVFEENEDIEILRFFELNIPVFMVETAGSSLAVDVPEDVAVVEEAMRKAGIK